MEISELQVAQKPSFSPGELEDAQALVRDANWNQLPADWRLFLELGSVFTAQTGAGRVVATAATLPFSQLAASRDKAFAWISMVLVTPEYRRRGIATVLMRRAMEELASRNLLPVLDATPDGRAVYRKLGFQDSWGFQRLIRREGAQAQAGVSAGAGVSIRSITDADWEDICAYDAAAFGADRSGVLGGLRGRLRAAELIAEREGRIAGFLVGRDGRVAAHIGPLIAEEDAIACALAERAVAALPRSVIIDVADAKTALRDVLTSRGFTSVRPFTRMLHGTSRRLDDAERTFAVIGPEFG
ncbi:MAG: GNAT family N-acetyltransferase [Xanthobacteraceae bacterium]